MGDTKISWTMGDDGSLGKTWNPVRGCSRISEGCRNCYAERVAARFSGPGQPYHGFAQVTAPRDLLDRVGGRRNGWTRKVDLVAEHLADPLRWRKPRRIFVNSMSDLFHEGLTNEQIAAVFGVMAAAPQHTFQVLTKRAKRMREWFAWAGDATRALRRCGDAAHDAGVTIYDPIGKHAQGRTPWNDCRCIWPLPNVWIGVSVEDQAAADERIPELLATPAAVRFLSCEPLIGPVNLDQPRCDDDHHGPAEWGLCDDEATPWCHECEMERSYGHWLHLDGGIDWVIAGCESGPGARPCSVEWLRSLRDQCAEAGTAFFLKQAVEPTPHDQPAGLLAGIRHFPVEGANLDGSKRKPGGVIELPYLDGVQHVAFPETSHV